MTKKNPLLQVSDLPYGAPKFSVAKVEDFMPAVKEATEEARREFDQVRYLNTAPTFQNTIEALEFIGKTRNRVSAVIGSIASCNSNDQIRAVEADLNKEAIKLSSEIMLDPVIFSRVKTVYDARATLNLTSEQNVLLEETYKGYVRSGALLDDVSKTRLREINERLSDLGTSFKNNVIADTASYKRVVSDEAELAGLPDRVKAEYREAAEEEGLKDQWLIRLSPPPIDLYEYSSNRALREEIYRAYTTIGYGGKNDNRPLVLEIVQLRDEKAKLLGHGNYAEFVLEERMAKNPATVMAFLDKNEQVYRPAADEYLQKVKDYALKNDGLTDFKPWDFSYYNRRLKEEIFTLDIESLRGYFSLEKCIEGLVTHAEKLFGRKMVDATSKYDVWSDDVKVYEVSDAKTGEMIGLFYADYYAKPGAKSGGAWMNSIRERSMADGELQVPLVSNHCNYAKPSKDAPTLLSLDQVLTMYHEFGHGNHGLPTQGVYPSLSGTNVKWDYVEVPSQLMENWVLQKEVLDSFAEHYLTGEKLPAETIQKIKDMQNFDAGYFGLRQTVLAKIDMAWHMADPATLTTVEALEDKINAQSWLFTRESGSQSTSFGHLFAGGYAAGYYSYKWAEVLEADIFEVFLKKGLYDRASGDKLASTIYGAGGTKDPNILFEDMMGRKPDPDALFRREGLQPIAASKPPEGPRP